MNRRDALKSIAALAALVPTWLESPTRRKINLQAFCAEKQFVRYDVTSPYVQEATDGRIFRYATNGRICVRVHESEDAKGDEAGERPPAELLRWPQEHIDRWLPWRGTPVTHDDFCAWCMDTGKDGNEECEACGGYEEISCPACDGTGIKGPPCRMCHGVSRHKEIRNGGSGKRIRGIQIAEGVVVAPRYFDAVSRELPGAEFCPAMMPVNTANPNIVAVPFRFEGGHGLVVPLCVT